MKSNIIFLILNFSAAIFATTKEVCDAHLAVFNAVMDFSLTDGICDNDDITFSNLKSFCDQKISAGDHNLDVALQSVAEEQLKDITDFLLKHSPAASKSSRSLLITRYFDEFYLNIRDITEVLEIEAGPIQKNIFMAAFYWLIFLKNLNLFSPENITINKSDIDFAFTAFHNFVVSLSNVLHTKNNIPSFSCTCFEDKFACHCSEISSSLEHSLKFVDLCEIFNQMPVGPILFLMLITENLKKAIQPCCLVELLKITLESKLTESSIIDFPHISIMTA